MDSNPIGPLVHTTSEQIEALAASSTGPFLPPMRELADLLGVSLVTVHRAASRLRRRGILTYHRGGKLRITSRMPPLRETPRSGGAQRLRDALREAITDGILRPGTHLSKTAHYARQYRVSTHTVAAAFRELASAGLINKAGRAWKVGRGSPGQVSATGPDRPVIVLVMPKEHSWRGLHAPRTVGFCRVFSDEAQFHGVGLSPVLTDRLQHVMNILPAGRGEALQAIRELEQRLLGTLLIGTHSEVPDLADWLRDLSASRKPVLWFDAVDAGLPVPVDSPHFVRCRFAEEAAVREALRSLREAGHRVVAYPWTRPDWSGVRLAMVRRTVSETFPDMRVVAPRDDAEIMAWVDRDGPSRLPAQVRALARFTADAHQGRLSHPEAVANLTRAGLPAFFHGSNIMEHSLLLIDCLSDPEVTAWIAPNDERARYIYYWLRGIGMAVPRDLSLISFDNYAELHPLPVTTVDFGFAGLGYAAFHLLHHDVNVRPDSRGELTTVPRVVNRGSVGPPRSTVVVGRHDRSLP